jgi:hypothetical protein
LTLVKINAKIDGHMEINEVAVKSSFAEVMGARISITGPARGMYLITGRASSLESLVKTAGGEVVLRLNGGILLATLPFTGYLSLQRNHEISRIGPVTVDLKRLAKLSEMLAKANIPKPGNTG